MNSTDLRFILIALLFINTATLVQAQNSKSAESLKITPTGRLYYDGALYFDDETKLSNGMAIPDVRIGLKAVYQKWDFKLDFGYANKKVNPKDIHVRYNFNNSSFVKLGYYGELFGYESWESSSSVKFNGKTGSAQAFENGRNLGIVYAKWTKNIWLAAGFYGDTDAIGNSSMGNDGYAFTGRFLFSPLRENGKIFHIGASGTYRKADANGYNEEGKENPRQISYSASFGSTSVERRKPLLATITDADYQTKLNFELLGAYRSVYILAEYYQANVKRKSSLPGYKGSGANAAIGFLAIGGDYVYDSVDARLKRPGAGSLELLARYDYLDLDDYEAEIFGGRMSDISIGVNYYINKHVNARLNYSYIKLGNRSVFAAGETVNVLQTRIMVLF